jgi:signal transduction histidine kinase
MTIALKDAFNEGEESIDLLIQVWVRFIIAFCSLLVFFVEPNNTGWSKVVVDKLLISYCLYSACLLFVYDMQNVRKFASKYIAHWIDTLFFVCLVSMTGGMESVYFYFFFFPIIVASFSWGLKEGIKVTATSVVLSAVVSLSLALINRSFDTEDITESLVRPIYLIIFGYMIAYWGGGRIVLNRRLQLLKEISTNWNPRFGSDHAMKINLGRLVNFYDASRGFIVLEREDSLPKYVMHSFDFSKKDAHDAPKEIEVTTAKELLTLPRSFAVSYENTSSNRLKSFNRFVSYDVNSLESSERYLRECKALSSLFDDESFISVPYKQQGVTLGRLFLIAHGKEFSRSDVSFTKQVADVISSVIDNMQLIENLISEASGQERLRISLDVHDTTIQPYIGLTLALDALLIEFNSDPHLAGRVNEIIKMANMTIHDLRSYKDTLREKSLMRGEVLMSAIKNQGERLQRFYGIHFDFSGSVDPNLSGKVAEAAFQIIKEGLSNILRHTNSKKAMITVSENDEYLLLEISNETDTSFTPSQFMPKSISERAKIFHGEALVNLNLDGYTVVSVKLPLGQEPL